MIFSGMYVAISLVFYTLDKKYHENPLFSSAFSGCDSLLLDVAIPQTMGRKDPSPYRAGSMRVARGELDNLGRSLPFMIASAYLYVSKCNEPD